MAQGGQQVPPEVIEAMLRLSTNKEERDELKEQLAMSTMLTKMGMESNPRAPSGTIGGLGHVAGQTMQGYAGGLMRKKSMEDLAAARGAARSDRGTYIRGAMGLGGEYPDVSSYRMLDQQQYPDSLYQE